ncbi:glycosyltransferase family 2 protein (plasmid) [Halorussus salilacus]|uniref:glycosyltransferase family 2 protein n=1 Tax=Halorussus salilacus TaxID=2953750 RepID=UPI00209F7407|nr:glycosyltransferase family 2 protein [Halorussus salilacus]USZ69779.1 glycosyltransferase family 2 protein [Halorussus salilacus]
MSLQVPEDGRAAESADTDERLDGAHVVVGIPAYNEESGIGSTVLGVKRYADDVVVVDDGSTDRTPELAEQADVTVIRHERNRGKGAAVRTLFEYVQRFDCDALVLLDADGQHDPADIPALAAPVVGDEADMVIGSRYLDPEDADETPVYRRVGQVVLDFCTTRVTGADLTDTQSGFRAFSPEALERLTLTTDGMGVESEMIDSATNQGMTITERAIDARYENLEGQTYNPIKHGLTVMVFLARLAKRRPADLRSDRS